MSSLSPLPAAGDPASLQDEVTEMFAQVLELRVPTPDTDLIASGLLDSLAFVNLLLELERRFGARVDMETLDLDDFRTSAAVTRFVAGRLAESAAPNGGAAAHPAGPER